MAFITNGWNGQGHEFTVVSELPAGAVADNWIELDGEAFLIYSLPGVPVFGRSFAAMLWAETLEQHPALFESVWEQLHADDDGAESLGAQEADVPPSGLLFDPHYPFEDDPFDPYPPEDSPLRLV